MSKIGFRREILGFNRDDVVEYIKKSQKETEQREQELVAAVDKLNKRNAKLLEKLEELPKLEAKLKLSEETIERLSEEAATIESQKRETEQVAADIAKTYLVAKANADAAEKTAREKTARADYEVAKTMESIAKIHNRLKEIKEEIASATEDYSNELNSALSSFEDAKQAIENSNEPALKKD